MDIDSIDVGCNAFTSLLTARNTTEKENINKKANLEISKIGVTIGFEMAPPEGLEPPTRWLTATFLTVFLSFLFFT